MAQPIFTVKYTLLLTAILLTSWAAVANLFSRSDFDNAPYPAPLADAPAALSTAAQTTIQKTAPAPSQSHTQASLQQADDLVDQALQYSLDGKYFDAANILIPLSQQGFSRAQLYLAVAYYHGHGVTRDRKKAEQMFFELRSKNYEPGIVNTYLNLLGSLPPA